MKRFNSFGQYRLLSPPGRIVLLLILLFVALSIQAQEKHSVQIKTFNQTLAPFPNLEVSINNGNVVQINNKGVGFTELSSSDLPVKSIQIKDEQLEAASWNYAKGTLEILVRKKNYRLSPVLIKNDDNKPVPNFKVTFNGKTSATVISDATGHIQVPLGLNEVLTGAEQFSAEGYLITSLLVSRGEHILIISRPEEKEIAIAPTKPTFNFSALDTIQSLPVFYSLINRTDLSELTQAEQQQLDLKFTELFSKMEQQKIGDFASRNSNLPRISDSTSLADDIDHLIRQAKLENQLLNAQRSEFDKKVFFINRKLDKGISNLGEEERKELLDQLTLLEDVMIEYESQFFKNQNDYRMLINDIRDHFSEFKDLEEKLTISERQRLEAERLYQQRLLAFSALAIVFAILIVALIYFGYALRKQKKALQRANDEVKRINDNLEVLIFNRTQLLQSAISELDTFLYRASHDLRAPVSSILGLCNLIEKAANGERKEIIGRIVNTSTEMDRLLKKLSVISEINRPRNLTSVTMDRLIGNVLETFDQQIKEKGIDIVIRCPEQLTFYTYPHLIEAVIFNLIDNALYFSALNERHSPKVEISAALNAGTIVISIKDNGIGIPEAMKSKVYDMFFKASEFSKGNGLGLYIVQTAVQTLDGKITLESVYGQFTEFTIHLPVKSKEEIKKEEALHAILTPSLP